MNSDPEDIFMIQVYPKMLGAYCLSQISQVKMKSWLKEKPVSWYSQFAKGSKVSVSVSDLRRPLKSS